MSAAQQLAASHASQFDDFADYILTTQAKILSDSEVLDGSGRKFVHDRWEREPGNANAGATRFAHAGRRPRARLARRAWQPGCHATCVCMADTCTCASAYN